MIYNDTPLPAEQKNLSQSKIRANFQTLQAYLENEHDAFATGTGKHKFITLPVSAPVVAAGEIALFSALSALTGLNELNVQRFGEPTVETTACLKAIPGWTRLPSGILLKWGTDNTGAVGMHTTNFPVAATIPAFTTIFNILVTTAYVNAVDGDLFVRLNSFAAPWTSFTTWGSARTTITQLNAGFTYLAIGV